MAAVAQVNKAQVTSGPLSAAPALSHETPHEATLMGGRWPCSLLNITILCLSTTILVPSYFSVLVYLDLFQFDEYTP